MGLIGWEQIAVEDVVLGGDGQDWSVQGIDHARARVTLVRLSDGVPWEGTPAAPVTERVRTAGEVVMAAAQTVQQHLSGAVMLGPDGWPQPAGYDHPGTIRAHLWIMHGDAMTQVPDELRALIAAHDQLHDVTQRTEQYVHHTHGML
jgi:hypothetical protein